MKLNTLITLLCITTTMYSMEEQQVVTREPREWNAELYDKGNWIQEEAFLHFLNESSITYKNKNILDIGCGAGNITAKIAQVAQKVHGFDASLNMITYATQKYSATPNVTFQHCFAEDFSSHDCFDMALSSFCIQWIDNKEQALKKINAALKMNGDLFGNLHTTNTPEHLNMVVAHEMIPGYDLLRNINIIKATGIHDIDDDTFKTMLTNAGFEIVAYEQKSMSFLLKDRSELEAYCRPLVMSRPLIQSIPSFASEWLFNKYIDLYLTKLDKNENGHYIFPGVQTTVFHARKIKNI